MKAYHLARVAKIVLLALAAGTALNASAQNWPVRSARIVVPFVPGGGTDIQGRLLGKKFLESMGQSFVVENRGGAGGLIGAEPVGSSPEELAVYFTREVDKYAKVIKAAQIRVE